MQQSFKAVLFLVLVSFFGLASAKGAGSVELNYSKFISKYDFDTSVAKIESAVKSKGMTVFAVIDHSKAAKEVEMNLRPTKVIIFGTPKAGTPLMEKSPELAVFLPLKALVTQIDKKVEVVIDDPANFAKVLKIDESLVAPLKQASKLIEATVTK